VAGIGGSRGGFATFAVRRMLLGVLVLFIVSVIVFASTQALGDPARAILGRNATAASLAALRSKLHLDQPAVVQYWNWLTGLFHGDLGTSYSAQAPVSSVLGSRLYNTAVLVVCAAVISIPASIALGSYTALKREKVVDTVSSALLLILAALPEFVVALLLVMLFSTSVFHGLLPAVSQIAPGESPWAHPDALILPTLTLVIAVAPYVARIMRASMIEVLESDYIEMARLKGLPERTVLVRHALPNSLGPVLQVIAINLAYLAGGVIVVEYVFNYRGIGSALQDAVVNHDIAVVQALAVLIAGFYIILNLIADVLTIMVTPRLRTRL
jgi:peptide/nickel transport system permease protein